MAGAPSGTVTFLFTDVQGSTQLWAAEPDAMEKAVDLHDAIVLGAVERQDGYVFSTAGDAFAAAFGRVSNAVAAALEVQSALGQQEWPTSRPIRIRIGLHLGEARERDGNYFGPDVNLAARVADAAHGGQVIATPPVIAIAGMGARDLGEYQLRDIAEPMRLFQLNDGTFPRLRVVDADRIVLPVPRGPIIGRQADVEAVRRLLVAAPVVTITGVGGAGKTRLAIAVTEEELAGRPAGSYFTDLSAAVTVDEVLAAVVASMKLASGGADLRAEIARFLSDKDALLVLDNSEHVLDACGDLVQSIVDRRGPARVLVTSREPLGVDGEVVFAIGALDVESAVDLFVQTALRVDPNLNASDHDAAIRELCRRLDSLPLALELAASRLTVLSPEELLARIDDRFRLLGGRWRGNRTRTLEATLAWSYDLLSLEEQAFFRRMSVFVGPFDAGASAVVGGVDEIKAVLLLDSLVSKSLVVVEKHAATTQYRLLETVRAYGQVKLHDAGESEIVRNLHLDHVLGTVPPNVERPADLRVVARRAANLDNMTMALDWAVAGGRWDDAYRLIAACCDPWLSSGAAVVGRRWIEVVLPNIPEERIEQWGFLKTMDGLLASMADDWTAAFARFAEMAAVAPANVAAFPRAQLAFLFSTMGDMAKAWELLELAEDRPEDEAFPFGAAIAWVRGTLHLIEDDVDAAAAAYEAGAKPEAGGELHGLAAYCGVSAAAVDIVRGAPERALQRLREPEVWDLFPIGSAPVVRAAALARLGRLAEASAEAATFARGASLGRMRRQANDALIGLAYVSLAEGDHAVARDLVFAASMPRSPHTMALGVHLADNLGEGEEIRQMLRIVRQSPARIDARDTLLARLSQLGI